MAYQRIKYFAEINAKSDKSDIIEAIFNMVIRPK